MRSRCPGRTTAARPGQTLEVVANGTKVVFQVTGVAVLEKPLFKEMLLLLIVLVNVVVGVAEAAGTWIPFKVPAVTPPTELVIVLNEILDPLEFLTRIPLTVPDTFA